MMKRRAGDNRDNFVAADEEETNRTSQDQQSRTSSDMMASGYPSQPSFAHPQQYLPMPMNSPTVFERGDTRILPILGWSQTMNTQPYSAAQSSLLDQTNMLVSAQQRGAMQDLGGLMASGVQNVFSNVPSSSSSSLAKEGQMSHDGPADKEALKSEDEVESHPFAVDMNLTFPVKLHMILSHPFYAKYLEWLPHGRAWKILKPKEFEADVIPKFFRSAKYASFMRQVGKARRERTKITF